LSPNMYWLIDVKNIMIYYDYVIALKYHGIQILCCQTCPRQYIQCTMWQTCDNSQIVLTTTTLQEE
jgi:hypothetical protein